jgi:hypothetical protein
MQKTTNKEKRGDRPEKSPTVEFNTQTVEIHTPTVEL